MKKLFGCVGMCRFFFPVLLLLCSVAGVKANNIRVDGKPRVVSVVGDTAVIEVNLRWDNSWRDDFNWDAAWVFFKYKKRELTNPWQHAYLSSSGHVLSSGYSFMVGANGGKVNGLYVMRNSISEGDASVNLQVKWPLNGTGLTRADFGDALNEIYVAVQAIEMVYIPYGAYYLGDDSSHLCFHEYFAPDRNPIRTKGYESLSASSIYQNKYPPEYAVDDNINSHYHSAGYSDEWFMIDFGDAKEMRYFTIRTHYAGTGYFLEGSNDGTSWSTLWSGSGSDWSQTQSKHKITNPGSYRYYRFRETGNYLVIYDVVLMENTFPVIDSEDALTLCINGDNSFISLSASYPKGYAGFYVMKYETSQEQYVEFLNSLTLDQQKARVSNNNFTSMKRGDYVFGDPHTPNCRNGIVFIEQRQPNTPVVFGNNLNPDNDLFSTDDGQTLACNYMSVEDMIAYCSWSGLRPMSELEYEKACRRFYPQVPDKGEYAWNTNSGINRLTGLGDLNFRGDQREVAKNIAKNVNSGIGNSVNGPVRCGMFGTSATNQSQSGATYWGVMEMSGNLRELCANVNYTNLDGGSCGAGVYNVAHWNTSINNYGVRGGGFNSADSLLRTSDRTEAMNYFTTITQRDSTVGFRGVYNLSGIKIDGGEIQAPETGCWSETEIENVQEASCPDFPNMRFQYNWYVKRPGEAKFDIVDNATGKTLKYEHFENKTAAPVVYTFKRTGICAIGVAESNEVTVKILPEPFAQEVYDFNAGSSVTLTQYWGTNASAQWWLDGAPSWAYVSGTTANSLTIAGGLASVEFTVKGKLAECPSDEFSAIVRINGIFPYTGKLDSVRLVAGKYKMECWGARAETHGGPYPTSYPGYGGYTKGEINLNATTTLYICVGSMSGYNGGGTGEATAGGASDIRIAKGNGNWNHFDGLKSRIMVAAGGGGGAYGTKLTVYQIGHAGGLKGYAANICTHNGCGYSGTGATQTSGGAPGKTSGLYGTMGPSAWGSFGQGGYFHNSSSGGGGGYYGGGHGVHPSSSFTGGGGGSSFISGHTGCDAVSASSTSTSIVHTGQSFHYSGLYFTNTVMIDGAGYQWTTAKGSYVGMPNLAGTGTMTGNTSHGQVKITPLN